MGDPTARPVPEERNERDPEAEMSIHYDSSPKRDCCRVGVVFIGGVDAGLLVDPGCPWAFWTLPRSWSRNGACPFKIFSLAASTPNHAALSTSGNSCCRPDFGGHSI